MNFIGPERVGGDGGDERTVDAAGQAEHDGGETVFHDVIAQALNESEIDGFQPLFHQRHFGGGADPTCVSARPVGDRHFFGPCFHLHGEFIVSVDDKGRAVEDQFVLSADLIDIGERQTAFADARQHKLSAGVELCCVIRRAIGDQQDFGTRLL